MPYQDDHKMIIPEKSEAGEEQLIPAEQHATLEPKRGKKKVKVLWEELPWRPSG